MHRKLHHKATSALNRGLNCWGPSVSLPQIARVGLVDWFITQSFRGTRPATSWGAGGKLRLHQGQPYGDGVKEWSYGLTRFAFLPTSPVPAFLDAPRCNFRETALSWARIYGAMDDPWWGRCNLWMLQAFTVRMVCPIPKGEGRCVSLVS